MNSEFDCIYIIPCFAIKVNIYLQFYFGKPKIFEVCLKTALIALYLPGEHSLRFVQIGEYKNFLKKVLTKKCEKFSTSKKFYRQNKALIFKVFHSIHRVFHKPMTTLLWDKLRKSEVIHFYLFSPKKYFYANFLHKNGAHVVEKYVLEKNVY